MTRDLIGGLQQPAQLRLIAGEQRGRHHVRGVGGLRDKMVAASNQRGCDGTTRTAHRDIVGQTGATATALPFGVRGVATQSRTAPRIASRMIQIDVAERGRQPARPGVDLIDTVRQTGRRRLSDSCGWSGHEHSRGRPGHRRGAHGLRPTGRAKNRGTRSGRPYQVSGDARAQLVRARGQRRARRERGGGTGCGGCAIPTSDRQWRPRSVAPGRALIRCG